MENQVASTILMVRPASFGYNAETAANNTFQSNREDLTQQEIQNNAAKEFDAFVATLTAKNIDVVVIPDTAYPVKPDAVFPNNWFATLPGGKMIVFPMFAANRRIEKRDDLLHKINLDYDVQDFQDWSEYEAEGLFLEGTGSMIIDHQNKIIYACLSPRTNASVLKRFSLTHDYTAVTFNAVNEDKVPVYHTNVIMHLGAGYAVICLESIETEAERIMVSQSLRQTGHEIIPISLQQVHAFAGNMLQVENKNGEKFTILSQQAFDALTPDQKQTLSIHTQLLPIAIPTIESIGGGSVRCMMAEIFLDKK